MTDPRLDCSYRHTIGSSSTPWTLGGDNEITEVIILRNGQRQVKRRCRNCGNLVGPLPKQAVTEWMSDLNPVLVRHGWDHPYPACSYRECLEPGMEWHHFAPRNTFTSDADNWPIMPLCQEHHRTWHRVMDGYRWNKKAGA